MIKQIGIDPIFGPASYSLFVQKILRVGNIVLNGRENGLTAEVMIVEVRGAWNRSHFGTCI
jgi:hypothetical protein